MQNAVKVGSRNVPRSCVALIRETHKFVTKEVGEVIDDQTQERKDRIQVHPSIVLRFYKRRREDDVTQRIIL